MGGRPGMYEIAVLAAPTITGLGEKFTKSPPTPTSPPPAPPPPLPTPPLVLKPPIPEAVTPKVFHLGAPTAPPTRRPVHVGGSESRSHGAIHGAHGRGRGPHTPITVGWGHHWACLVILK